ncbi:exported protein of unknown function [Beijerinckiaceae bacterium RH AL1]|nr:exported protein of unknown function [Beijerinckiaceae bacterium RH CH11]VVB45639.1 exported protein of unknown function [Beijerinckiaceae bacterium RH AL8]VVC54928.1 exported protein of unknown function [Beijerinckiaceae bacterium RH AL1]
MPKVATFLALALVAAPLAGAPARAEWRGAIAGSRPILPARFVPRQPPRLVAALPEMRDAPEMPAADSPISWIAPLVDRHLSGPQKSADIAPDLLEAISRIEPIYDPTRLEGPQTPVRLSVSAGTAAMDNVFADSWDRADPDANVNQRVPYIAMAWMRRGALPCEAFMKVRARVGYERPALSALTDLDCARLLRAESAPARDAAAPVPIVAGWIAVPAFAAPMPGSRLSSAAFWAARRAEIARVEDELRLRQVWHGGLQGVSQAMLQR